MTAPQARLEGCFCIKAGSTARPLSAAFTEAELFSSLHRQQLGNGISGFYIRFTANPTGVFRTVPYFALVPVKSTEPPITAAKTVSALFTSCLLGPLGNGTGE